MAGQEECNVCPVPMLWALVERSLGGLQVTVMSPRPSLLGALMGAGGTGGLFLEGGLSTGSSGCPSPTQVSWLSSLQFSAS